jgi:E3 ubiquitin-protein ligase UBR7
VGKFAKAISNRSTQVSSIFDFDSDRFDTTNDETGIELDCKSVTISLPVKGLAGQLRTLNMNPSQRSSTNDCAGTSGSSERKRKADEDACNTSKRSADAIDSDSDNEEEVGNDDGNYVTMVDVLEEEQKLEEEAFALLGGSDDKNCTYLHGYVGRQAIYACKTCRPNATGSDADDVAGVCLACSYACHEGHDLYELYTKRNFKCDCGNSRMKNERGGQCSLFPNKSATNELNRYNHNFVGRYCLCDRPYPDPEGESGVMIQCVVCEDWFHDSCLKTKYPQNDDFGELICAPCMTKHAFLWNYQDQVMRVSAKSESASSSSTLVNVIDSDAKIEGAKATTATTTGEPSGTDSGIESSCDSMLDTNQCKLKLFKVHGMLDDTLRSGATFWEEGWRKRLCRCTDCISMYRSQEIEFLSDETDTVHHYEAKGKEKGVQISHYERGLNEINKMDRVQSIEAITGKLKGRPNKSFSHLNQMNRHYDQRINCFDLPFCRV